MSAVCGYTFTANDCMSIKHFLLLSNTGTSLRGASLMPWVKGTVATGNHELIGLFLFFACKDNTSLNNWILRLH